MGTTEGVVPQVIPRLATTTPTAPEHVVAAMFVPANPGYSALHVVVHTVNTDQSLYGVGLLIRPNVGSPYLSPLTVEGMPLTRALSRFAIECHHWTNRLNEKD